MPLFNKAKLSAPHGTSLIGSDLRGAASLGARLFSSTVLVAMLLTGCAQNNPAARKATLEKFCTSVTQHILDRNPDTIKESLNTLYHEELSDPARQKLEDTKVIPDSPITVLREIEEWTKAHKSNRVDVGIVHALTPIDGKDVTFRVSGKDWDLVNGKATDFHSFQIDIVAELTPDMDGMARALEIKGLGPGGATVAAQGAETKDDAKSAPRRRRHR